MRVLIAAFMMTQFWSASIQSAPIPDGQRYAAMLNDGSRVVAKTVQNWAVTKQQPVVAGKAIFDPKNPVRWLIDRTLPVVSLPNAFVEFVGGDRLPCEVLQFDPGTASPFEPQHPHLLVQPGIELDFAGRNRNAAVRVTTEWLRRVVWKRMTNERYQPGTVFLQDGSEIGFRSLHWSKSAVVLLVDGKIRRVPFVDVAEIHLPRPDVWDVYYHQLAALTPTCQARLFQIETTDGLRATSSTERLQAVAYGDKNKPRFWNQLIQPAWSLDPLIVRFPTIRAWRFFNPDRVPLTMIDPVHVEQKSTFGSGWRWQVDRNVQQQPLQSNSLDFGWGFGVHASNQLHFELPATVKFFRSHIGLDQSVGNGGSVRASVALASNLRNRLFNSNVLVGSTSVVSTGDIGLSVERGTNQRLVLISDDAHGEQPTGADPFDIRDSMNWLEPELQLDAAALKVEVAKRLTSRIAAWRRWKIGEDESGAINLVNVWDDSIPDDARYILKVVSQSNFIRLTRRMQVSQQHKYLAVCVSRFHEKKPATQFQVRVGGQAIAEFDVPERVSGVVPDPIMIPIERFRGQDVVVELIQIGGADNASVDWRGVTLVDRRPGLLTLFEDDERFLDLLNGGDGKALLDLKDKHSGQASLVVTPLERSNARLPGLNGVIRERPQLGQYRFLTFAWSKTSGINICLELAHEGQWTEADAAVDFAGGNAAVATRSSRPLDRRGIKHGYRYEAGRGETDYGPVLSLNKKLPTDWKVITRDLYSDFGDFTLTGLKFRCPEGECAWFDRIYLARTQQDFNHIAELLKDAMPAEPVTPNDPKVAKLIRDRWRFSDVLSTVAPAFSTAAVGEGLQLVKEHNGRKNVVRTMPLSREQACILRAPVSVPKGKSTRLQMSVSHHPEGDWQLIVVANGEKLHDSIIGKGTVKNGWLDVAVDLSKFAGKNVIVEIHNHANGWHYEAGYWSRLEIVSE